MALVVQAVESPECRFALIVALDALSLFPQEARGVIHVPLRRRRLRSTLLENLSPAAVAAIAKDMDHPQVSFGEQAYDMINSLAIASEFLTKTMFSNPNT